MLCKLCHKNPATVRDRDKPYSPRREVCGQCHAERLMGDLRIVLNAAEYCPVCQRKPCECKACSQ